MSKGSKFWNKHKGMLRRPVLEKMFVETAILSSGYVNGLIQYKWNRTLKKRKRGVKKREWWVGKKTYLTISTLFRWLAGVASSTTAAGAPVSDRRKQLHLAQQRSSPESNSRRRKCSAWRGRTPVLKIRIPVASVIKLFSLSLTLQTNQCDHKTLKISPKKVDKTIVKTKICQNIFIKAQFLSPKHLQQNPSECLKYIQQTKFCLWLEAKIVKFRPIWSRVRVNQRLVFPLTSTDFLLSA
jgi:hypothetical protein